MAPVSKPFQLLEINIISAQDLEPITQKMRTYAKAWVHPNRKLSSCMDTEGNNNPTWNDKFVFRVDEEFLRRDTSAVMIEIYTSHWFRDVLVGTVRVLVGNLIPPPVRSGGQSHHIGLHFVALQVRRPSGRPQGILNMGVALLDGSLRSMPLYTDCTSAVGYRDLMQGPLNLQQPQRREDQDNDINNNQDSPLKPVLRRSRSERSECMAFDNYSPNSSMVAVPTAKVGVKDGFILNISEFVDPFKGMKKKGKASSVINGAELREKPKRKGKKGKASSVINGAELREKPKRKGKKGRASSVVSDSFHSKRSSSLYKKDNPNLKNNSNDNDDKNKKDDEKPGPDELSEENTNKMFDEKSVTKVEVQNADTHKETPSISPTVKPRGSLPLSNYVSGGRFRGSSILAESEIGPSPSEVAATMAGRRYPLEDNQSSVLDGWSLDESVEGLQSKLQRWRTELPPLYDNGYSTGSFRSSVHTRRHSESGSGLFSCFGNICGIECQCVCGKPPGRKKHGSRFASSSVGSPTQSFL